MKNENLSYLVKNHPPQKTLISLEEEYQSKKSNDYLFFFLIWLIIWLIPKKITPKAPIIYGMPISKILLVVGQSSLIRYPKIQDIAEMIMSIIPIIKNPFFVSIFSSPSSKYPIMIINIFGGPICR